MDMSRRQVRIGLRKHEPMTWLGSQRNWSAWLDGGDQVLFWLFSGDSSPFAERLAIRLRIRAVEEVVYRTTSGFTKRRGT